MATIVRALWLAAERASFSCNDPSLLKIFSARRLFWVVSKSYKRAGENNKKYRQNITIFWITESKILAYWYASSMRDEEATARASFIIQRRKNRPKLSKTILVKLALKEKKISGKSRGNTIVCSRTEKWKHCKKCQVIWSVFTVFLAR